MTDFFDHPYDAVPEAEEAQEQPVTPPRSDVDKYMWESVIETEEGRYVLFTILDEYSRPFQLSFNPASTHMTAFREGERNVGMRIIERAFGGQPELYDAMNNEARYRKGK